MAARGAEARPVEAADLYRPQLESDLRHPNTKLYPGIAATLATMAELYERGGRSADFTSFIAQIRQDYADILRRFRRRQPCQGGSMLVLEKASALFQ